MFVSFLRFLVIMKNSRVWVFVCVRLSTLKMVGKCESESCFDIKWPCIRGFMLIVWRVCNIFFDLAVADYSIVAEFGYDGGSRFV